MTTLEFGCRSKLLFELVTQPQIIIIQKSDPLSPSGSRAHIPCFSQADTFWRGNDSQTRVSDIPQGSLSRRLGAVYHDDYLQVAVRLPQRTVNSALHVNRSVPGGNNDTDQLQ